LKRLIAIALLGLQIFTICGHLLLYQYFVYQSDRELNQRIANNEYTDRDLVEIKIPAHTAITQSWTEYQYINGQIQFKNTCYNYVKVKLTADTIYLACLPNHEKTRLFNQNIINAKVIDEAPLSKKDQIPFGKGIDLGKYNYTLVSYHFSSWVTVQQQTNVFTAPAIASRCITVPLQPPKLSC
jgi:hypothetical protein